MSTQTASIQRWLSSRWAWLAAATAAVLLLVLAFWVGRKTAPVVTKTDTVEAPLSVATVNEDDGRTELWAFIPLGAGISR